LPCENFPQHQLIDRYIVAKEKIIELINRVLNDAGNNTLDSRWNETWKENYQEGVKLWIEMNWCAERINWA